MALAYFFLKGRELSKILLPTSPWPGFSMPWPGEWCLRTPRVTKAPPQSVPPGQVDRTEVLVQCPSCTAHRSQVTALESHLEKGR